MEFKYGELGAHIENIEFSQVFLKSVLCHVHTMGICILILE